MPDLTICADCGCTIESCQCEDAREAEETIYDGDDYCPNCGLDWWQCDCGW